MKKESLGRNYSYFGEVIDELSWNAGDGGGGELAGDKEQREEEERGRGRRRVQVCSAGEAPAAEAHQEVPPAGELQLSGHHRQVREWGAHGGCGEAATAAQAKVGRGRHFLNV